MEKKTYIKPVLFAFSCQTEIPLAVSNRIDGSGVQFNKESMVESDGDDAAVKGSYWDDVWD